MAKNSLVENINRKKKSGTSRSKKKSTVSKEAYQEMEKGWPGKGRTSAKKAAKKATKKTATKKTATKKASKKTASKAAKKA